MAEDYFERLTKSPALPSIQIFQEHGVSSLGALHQYHSIFDLACQLQYSTWSQDWKGRVKNLDVDRMLAQSNDAMEVGFMKSTMQH